MRPGLLRGLQALVLVALVLGIVFAARILWLPVRVAGGSMSPALLPGDLAVVDRRASVVSGSIALLRSDRHGLVLHRVLERFPDGAVRTRGDANPVEDFRATPATGVVGPVVLVVPFGVVLQRWRGSGSCATMTAQ
ncbi:MAG: hypothetical protein HGB10_06010 [Coriobacteriia bacterium]|nr:hypothetical protein [Coriobacteriia bacterium]